MSPLIAAVVGLGRVGSRFDEEPRPCVWSHAGAYLARADRFRLAAGADPDDENRNRFRRRCPEARVFSDAAEMAAAVRPDVVSVCTPPDGRAELIERLLAAHAPKVLIVEKPLATSAPDRRRIVAACAGKPLAALVNYNRRFSPVYRRARALIAEGRLGTIASITVLAPNRLWSVGSHAVNLLLFLAGARPARAIHMSRPALAEAGEPAADILCDFPGGAAGRVVTAGTSDMLIFEADVVGSAGRLRVIDNGARALFAPFTAAPAFPGYRVAGAEETVAAGGESESTFLALVDEAFALARGGAAASSTLAEACASEDIVEAAARA